MTAIRTLAATKALAGITARDAGGVLRPINLGRIRDASSVLRSFFGSISAALSRESVAGAVNSSLDVSIQTQSVEAQPTGGTAPYSFAWSITGSAGGTWSITSPTQASTTFVGGPCGPGESFEATFVCTVTDAAGISATTDEVEAIVSNIGFNATGGGGPLP
jgi:hypothetical protein